MATDRYEYKNVVKYCITCQQNKHYTATYFACFGVHEQVVSNNGPQFSSEEFSSLMRNNGTRHVRILRYHPSSNEMEELFVQTFKQSMKEVRVTGEHCNSRLPDKLPYYTTLYNNQSPMSLLSHSTTTRAQPHCCHTQQQPEPNVTVVTLNNNQSPTSLLSHSTTTRAQPHCSSIEQFAPFNIYSCAVCTVMCVVVCGVMCAVCEVMCAVVCGVMCSNERMQRWAHLG